jgi:hypothetical protein
LFELLGIKENERWKEQQRERPIETKKQPSSRGEGMGRYGGFRVPMRMTT